MLKLLPACGYTRMAWKNGGGETAEIAVGPAGAEIDRFDWRISMATVSTAGPFSRFEGIDRTLLVIAGNGIELKMKGERRVLRVGDPPFSFPADADVSARLLDGPIVDLNVMSRRGRWTRSVSQIDVGPSAVRATFSGPSALFCRSGKVIASAGQEQLVLEARDTARVSSETLTLLSPQGGAQLLLIRFQEIGRVRNGGRDRD